MWVLVNLSVDHVIVMGGVWVIYKHVFWEVNWCLDW